MTSDWRGLGSSYPTRLSSQPIEAIQHLKVSFENPETSTDGGMDSERCSALHITTVKHAWQAQGYDLPLTIWWQKRRLFVRAG